MNVENLFTARHRANKLSDKLLLVAHTEKTFHAIDALDAMDKLETEMRIARVELQAIIDKGK